MSGFPDGDEQADHGREPVTSEPPGLPTWVKILGALALAILVVVVVLLLSGDGQHGPRRHMPHGADSMLNE